MLISAPTASGKTEAVIAPVAEIAVKVGYKGLHTLYIVPTRALANDLLFRIQGPLSEMGILVYLKHGDEQLPSNARPEILITTPESVDSLLCRAPNLFIGLRAVIIDEIHLIDGTPRGDQMRILLYRLRNLVQVRNINVHLISATIAEPTEVASRYSEEAVIINDKGRRLIQLTICGSDEEMISFVRLNQRKKLIYFCNYRSSVEKKSQILTPLWKPYPVVAHHGRKSRKERLESEQIMKEAKAAICIATSTLEIGIDIGDIDTVILGEIPWSVSSLVQRVGRSNRRSATITAIGIANDTEETEILESMVLAANEGTLEHVDYFPDISVAIQQIYSVLFAKPDGMPERELVELLKPLCGQIDAMKIINHLRKRNLVEDRAGHVMASTHIMDLGESGLVHSNIPDNNTYEVVDVNSHRVVGYTHDLVDRVFFLLGKLWQAERIENNKIYVTEFEGELSSQLFKPAKYHSAFWRLLPSELQK